MSKLSRWCENFSGPLLSIMRLVVGFLFFQHGLQKLLGMLGGDQPEFGTLLWVAGLLEFFGGLCIIFGVVTRVVAFLLSGQMAVAYFQVHAPQGFWPVQNGGELAALYCFVFLYLSAVGAGPWSIDAWLARSKRGHPLSYRDR